MSETFAETGSKYDYHFVPAKNGRNLALRLVQQPIDRFLTFSCFRMSVNSYNPISVPLSVTDPDVPNCADGIDQENLESETQESLITRLQNAVQNEEKFDELEVKKQTSETIFADIFGDEIDFEDNIELCKGDLKCKIVRLGLSRPSS